MKQTRSLLAVLALVLLPAFALAQPINDNFADRILLRGMLVFTNGTTANGTKQPGEPNHAGNTGGKSVWYEWVAPISGPVSLSASSTGYRDLLAVYTGNAVNSLSVVASAASDFGSGDVGVGFEAVSGTRYKIAFDVRNNNAGGAFSMSLVMPNTVFPLGSVWKYLDDGSDQGTAWRTNTFNDNAWASGPGQLGYGDGDESTVVSFGPDPFNKYVTTYFRRTFTIANPTTIVALVVGYRRDDGIVIYLNGVEVVRDNMPAGEINYLTFANGAIGDDGNNVNGALLPLELLRPGENLLAAEIHQSDLTSSDITFDALVEAYSTGNALPDVAITNPSANATFRPGTNININISASDTDGTVTNVALYADTLKLAEFTSAPYTFTWTNVPQGNYTLTAIATDNSGDARTSTPVPIYVNTFTILPVTLIPTGSLWKYLDNGTDQGTAWQGFGFDDSGWNEGVGELGYGDGDEATVISFGPDAANKYPTTYFRRYFTVDNASAVSNLTMRLIRDDGAIVYINGVEVARVDMPFGPVDYLTYSTAAADFPPDILSISPSVLLSGLNVIAAEVHQGNGTSSDLSFELSLIADTAIGADITNTIPPVVQSKSPPPGGVSSLTSIQVWFSEGVTGVNASDLLINGIPATSVSGGGNAYTFTFPHPPFGPVNITWATGHGIQDSGSPQLPFDANGAGATWSYTLQDTTPPTIATRNPPAGATLTNLTQIDLTFSENVTGVNASDLLINGTPAVGLIGSGANYTFSFGPPAPGAVNITWAPGHGIADTSPSQNGFDGNGPGATWGYTLEFPRTMLVDSNSFWNFQKGTNEASAPADAWRFLTFNDASWSNAPAPFFFGDPYSGTLLSDMQGFYTSVYLRKTFVVNNRFALTNLTLRVNVDDGCIVWINGLEVQRIRMNQGDHAYDSVASSTTPQEGVYTTLVLPSDVLVNGSNVIAIHAFNQSIASSSDFAIDAQLLASVADPSYTPPNISFVSPPAGDVFYLTNITVTFNEGVQGVNASDLLVNGVPATSVTGTSNLYTFRFTQPVYGPVFISWAVNHGIQDFDSPPKTFDATAPGATFQYSLVNPSAPTVAGQVPLSGATVSALTQVQVTFSENVSGVNASDFLVNGVPASGMTGSGANYTFTFLQPAYGNVAVSWVNNHGIRDTEPAQNAFDAARPGATWQYNFVDLQPPTIFAKVPAAGANVTNLTQMQVTFSENVSGVNASDLLVNGTPATGFSGSGSNYTFNFPQPNASVIQVSWANNHGIADFAVVPNAFNPSAAGATWSYTSPDNVPPSIATLVPLGGITLRSLTQVEIVFNESVTGVNAADLTINNVPATTVVGSGAGPYVFQFPQPPTGAVEVAFITAHGIRDLAVPPNNFAGGNWTYFLNPNAVFDNKIVINEIMYHPTSEQITEEWIELHNTDTAGINLTGWRFDRGINFTFPNVTIPAGGYLVVAADVEVFQQRYPGVANVIGGWTGRLSNGDEEIRLRNALGETVDSVSYADEGDWGIRQRGPLDQGARGWEWFAAHDGNKINTATGQNEGGRTLELRNPTLGNQYGQNWAASGPLNGTPGTVNSVRSTNIEPMVLDVRHFPPVPRSDEAVTVTARIRDERTNGHVVMLFHALRTNTAPATFASLQMFDDGLHNDGQPNDGVFGAILPARFDRTVVEFYVEARDPQDNVRTWPAAARQVDGSFAQTANALYQVDDTVYTGIQPYYRLIMTESERIEFQNINRSSDAEMNATFISIDGEGAKVRYLCGLRIRGAGSRGAQVPNYRVNIPIDRRWNGLNEINLNSQYPHAQLIGSAVALRSGLAAANARAVQVRVNGANLQNGNPPFYGAYVFVEPLNSDWAGSHFPNDGDGNVYRASRAPWTANLDYRGTNPQTYINEGYSKTSNQSENDWTDLFNLTFALTQIAPEADYLAAVRTNANVVMWMRYFAVLNFMDYRETSLVRGVGDDYAMYRPMIDTRFLLLPHDFDTIFGQGDTSGSTTRSIWDMILNPSSNDPSQRANFLQRFMRHNEFAPIYFAELKRLAETTFSPAQLNPLVDQLLGDWVPGGQGSAINAIKNFNAARVTSVLAQIPQNFSVSHNLPTTAGYPTTTSSTITLLGDANGHLTRAVRVNGSLSAWSAWQGRWTNSAVQLRPGLNRLTVEAIGETGEVVNSTTLDVLYDNSSMQNVSGTIATDTTWSPNAGPYVLTANVTVASGAILTIQPGTTVYLGAGVNLNIANGGRLLAEGTVNAPIRFSRVPGTATSWGSIIVNGSVGSPETRITYAHFEFNGGTAINSQGGTVFLDHLTFGNTARMYVNLDASSFVVSHCVFPTATDYFELVHGSGGIKAGGRGIFRKNFFGVALSQPGNYNDVVDFTGGNRPGPIVEFIDNVFMGSGDDLIDLDGTDAWIEGNIFLHVHQNGSPDSASAISGGNDSTRTSEITILGNIFYDVDHLALAKQGNFYTVINNTIVRQTRQGGVDTDSAVINFADEGTTEGAGVYLEGNIIYQAEKLLRHRTNAIVVVTNNLMPFTWSGAGGNNSTNDPGLVYIPELAETSFTSWQAAQVMKTWLAPGPGSPALGSGPNGRDKGGVIPVGASITGEPQGITSVNGATLTVGPLRSGNGIPATGWPGGSGYTHYRWRLDGGVWTGETPTSTPITLSGLAPGQHYVEISGKRDSGLYQDDLSYSDSATITASRIWTVNAASGGVRINEVMARNQSAVNHQGTYPDIIELVNITGSPINIGGWRITDDLSNPDRFIFPSTTIPAHGYLLLYANNPDGTAGIHLGFGLGANGETLYLYDAVANGGALIDSVTFGLQLNDYSIGRLADGNWTLTLPTFGSPNRPARLGNPDKLRINEWLAAGLNLAANDFIELYNPEPLPVPLGGLFLTDEPIGWPDRHAITPLSFVPANGYVVFTADGDVEQGAEHVGFQLTPEQGMIGLFHANLALIDCVFYQPQRVDISQGRSPNGAGDIVFFAQPTPGAPNATQQGTNQGVVINEVLASNNSFREADGSAPDWVEFYNLSATPVDISDMSFTDNVTLPRRFVFPAGTTLPGLGYLRLRCDGGRPVSSTNSGFGIGANGGGVFLFDKLANGGGLVSSVSFGLQATDYSIGRVPNGTGGWILTFPSPGSANIAAGLGNVSALRVNEWMADPVSGDDWFEIYNPNNQPVSVGGLYLTDDLANRTKSPIPALSFIGASTNGYQRFLADGNTASGAHHTSFSLARGGESIALAGAGGVLIDAVTFGPQDTGVSEGRFPDASATIVKFPLTASPGEANYLWLTNVVINEALAHTDPPLEDAIELRNLSGTPLDIGRWWLSDAKGNLRKYQIPAGTVLPANGYFVVYEYHFNDSNSPSAFALSSAEGDEIYLSAADSGGVLTGYRSSVKFGASENSVSFGRYVTSDQRDEFVAMSGRSFGQDDPATVAQFRLGTGAANLYPKVGPIVISQIMYHPPDVGTNDDVLSEFVELRNTGGATVNLFDALHPANTWRLRDAMDFDFPSGVSLPAGDRLLVVSFDPVANTSQLAAFRSKYGVPVSIPVYGPYSGRLENSSDNVELYKPDAPGLDSVPYVLADRVRYSDSAPWPAAADGAGSALQRVSLSGFGNDPTNWVAVVPNFGGTGDNDGDGIPGVWENLYGFSDNNPSDAHVDSDGDGMTNLQEYLSGTHPLDSNDVFRVVRVQPSGANVVLTFPALANRSYTVEYRTNLNAGSWIRLSDHPPMSTNRLLQITTPAPAPTRFYRVRTPQLP